MSHGYVKSGGVGNFRAPEAINQFTYTGQCCADTSAFLLIGRVRDMKRGGLLRITSIHNYDYLFLFLFFIFYFLFFIFFFGLCWGIDNGLRFRL